VTEATGVDARITGSLLSEDGKGVVRMEGNYDTDIEDLWSALTDPQRLGRWVAKVEGDPRLGSEVRASFTSGWTGPCRIDECDPPHRLVVSMSPGQDSEAVLVAELTPDGDQTRLVIEERGLDLDDLPYHGAGWQAHVEDLSALLADRKPADWEARWKELTPGYEKLAVAAR
jgi:uncharacterized protein YndB with AHSA1/START domain